MGHDLAPETSAIKTYSYYATVGNTVRNVTLVDTPGFDDNREDMTDVDILNHMADFLQNKCVVVFKSSVRSGLLLDNQGFGAKA